MKKIIVSALIISIVSLLSCSLDENPSNLTAELMAGDESGAEQLVTGIYSTFWTSYMMKKTYQEWIDMDHDMVSAPDWVVSGAGQGNVTTHWGYNGDSDLFYVFYLMINRCNVAKEAFLAANIDNPSIGQRYGEVLFLRAFAYFNLVRMYGPVPLRLESISPDNCARAPIAEVYDVIVSDLMGAIKYLHDPSSGYVGQWGHATQTAARILLARVYCTMASGKLAGQGVSINVNIMNQSEQAMVQYPDKYPTPLVLTPFTTGKVLGNNMEDGYARFDAGDLYNKAKEQCDTVIGNRGIDYDLRPEWTQIWGSPNYKNNEFVFGIASIDQSAYRSDGGSYYYTAKAYGGSNYVALSDGCWAMYEYNKDAAQNDERASKGVFHYWKNGSFDAGLQWYRFPAGDLNYNTAPDGQKPESSQEYVTDGTSDVTGWYRGAAYSNKWYFGDISNPAPMYEDRGYGLIPQDIIFIRFAEVFLLRAEALNELDQGGKALSDLNVIRNRAKARLYTTTDKVELRSWIFQERGIEFTQEFMRKFDLLRWGMYLNVMNTTQTILNSSNQVISLVREPRCLLYAVPTSEVQQNKLFGNNNPGW